MNKKTPNHELELGRYGMFSWMRSGSQTHAKLFCFLSVAPDGYSFRAGLALRTYSRHERVNASTIRRNAKPSVSPDTDSIKSFPKWPFECKRYRCDTADGSSDGPIFDNEGNMRALHHLMFDLDPDDYTPAAGPRDRQNKTVCLSGIVIHLDEEYSVELSEQGYLLPPPPQ